MTAFTWTDLAVRQALGLRADLARGDLAFAGVSTDSRTVGKGDLYVALVGPRFDGHDFVPEALSRGARGAVVSRHVAGDATPVLYPVDDTLVALGALAAHRRSRLEIPVVGITGSVGKTTTKELIRGALTPSLAVHATAGNLNNRIGLPMTLLSTPGEAEVVVLEMGTNEPGEIGLLAAIARPDVGVLVSVGESHLEKLASVEGVLEEKLDLLRHLAPDAQVVVGDEPDFMVDAARTVRPELAVAGWSTRADAWLRPGSVEVDAWGAYRFAWQGQTVSLAIPGRHAVTNALLALAVSRFLGVPARAAAHGLSTVGAGAMRSEVRRIGDLTVLVDCYNANPPSVRAALSLLEEQAAPRKVAVLGTMLELGSASSSLHRDVLAHALAGGVDLVVATGGFADAAAGMSDDRIVVAADWRIAYPMLRDHLRGDEVVLLKASRGVALEGMLPLLASDFAPTASQEV